MTDGTSASAPSTETAPADEPSTDVPSIRVVSGDPTAEELAAVTAILASLEAERSAASAERREIAEPTAWSRSQRPLRSPLNPGPGAWRHGNA